MTEASRQQIKTLEELKVLLMSLGYKIFPLKRPSHPEEFIALDKSSVIFTLGYVDSIIGRFFRYDHPGIVAHIRGKFSERQVWFADPFVAIKPSDLIGDERSQ